MSEALSPDATAARARKNRILLLLLAASFIVPFLVGDLAYRMGWYEGGQTNKGRLIDPPVPFASLSVRDSAGKVLGAGFADKHWWLLHVMEGDCATACRNRLFQMRQVRRALGKEGDRLRQALVLTSEASPATRELLAREFPDFVLLVGEAAPIDAAFRAGVATPGPGRSGAGAPAAGAKPASQAGELYIMDPMGWIMLAYPPEANEKRSVEKAEDVLSDLRKLLKASRIG